jgi:hypothetical protein
MEREHFKNKKIRLRTEADARIRDPGNNREIEACD